MSEEPGITLGVCMAVRDFECLLCGKPYSRMSADCIMPSDRVCDECLAELGRLPEKELWETIARRQANSKENRGS
jgi:hypothetical protein